MGIYLPLNLKKGQHVALSTEASPLKNTPRMLWRKTELTKGETNNGTTHCGCSTNTTSHMLAQFCILKPVFSKVDRTVTQL